MENEFLDKVEDNAAVRTWSEKLQSEKGDSLTEGYTSGLQNFNHKQLFRAMAQFLNSAYSSFTFGEVDLVPTMEEYTTLLRCPKIQVSEAYAKVFNGPTFAKKLMSITGMSEPWVTARIQQKGDNERKRIDIFALSIYGLVIFPKALMHVDEAVTDLFDRLEKGITPVPAILAETFRSLSVCRRAGEVVDGVVSWAFLEGEQEEKWMEILQNLKEGDIEWKAFWMVPDEILYRYGKFDWVPLPGIWSAIGYTPLLALRQYKSR
ncbi:hypothetical protein CXB51_010822 [Gossypium anomalum]|uniref:DUF7745 domain-containing protein n=1 Tax=Gossypium anomalum TaxID=47600 RepID=A0A8J5Z7T4_9ROSI|nr:hypothetical protein CXB51_010822 [Gossypium anomalum]